MVIFDGVNPFDSFYLKHFDSLEDLQNCTECFKNLSIYSGSIYYQVSQSNTGSFEKILIEDDLLPLNTFSSSIYSYTSSVNTSLDSLNSHTGSINTWTGSFSSSVNIRLNSLTSSLNSLNTFSASIYSYTASLNAVTSSFFKQGGNSFGTTGILGTNDTFDLVFESNGTSRMIISSSGRVGIRTLSPQNDFEVIGSGFVFRDSQSTNTNNTTRLYGGAYSGNFLTNIVSFGTSTGNSIIFGGGTGGGEAATAIDFNTTTTVGSVGAGSTRMRINSAGSVGIGSTSLTAYSLRLVRTVTGSTTGYGISNESSIGLDVTTTGINYNSTIDIPSGSSVTTLIHYMSSQGSIVGGVIHQNGFYANSNLTSATNNYGFRGVIPSSSGRWNLYMDGTAINYLNGALLIGSTTNNGQKIQVVGTSYFSDTLSIGTVSPSAVALLDITSTTKGFLPPRMTTTQKNAITAVAGLVIYDTTLSKLQVYTTAWESLH